MSAHSCPCSLSSSSTFDTSDRENKLLDAYLGSLKPYPVFYVGEKDVLDNEVQQSTEAMSQLKTDILAAVDRAGEQWEGLTDTKALKEYQESAMRIAVNPDSFWSHLFPLCNLLGDRFNDTVGILGIQPNILASQYFSGFPRRPHELPLNFCASAVFRLTGPDRINRLNRRVARTQMQYDLSPFVDSMAIQLCIHAIAFPAPGELPRKSFRQCLRLITASLNLFAELAQVAGINLENDPIPPCMAIWYADGWFFAIVALCTNSSGKLVLRYEKLSSMGITPITAKELYRLTETSNAIGKYLETIWWQWVSSLLTRMESLGVVTCEHQCPADHSRNQLT